MNRDLEKERVLSTHKNEINTNQMTKLKRDLEDRELKIKEIDKQVDLLSSAMSLNPLVKQYEQKNLELGQKILKCEKEKSMADAKIKESEMLLEVRAKDRELEAEQKRELVNKIEIVKLEIDEAKKMNELIIQQKVKEKEEADIREKNKEIENVRKTRTLLEQRIQQEEDEIERISQDKVTLQQDIIDQDQTKEKLAKDLDMMKKSCHELVVTFDFLTNKEKELNALVGMPTISLDICRQIR